MDWSRIDELREEIGEEDLADVLALFLEEVEERLENLSLGDAIALADDLHFVKSAALNIGFASLADLSAEMETAARDGSASADVSKLKACFGTSCDRLSAAGVSVAVA